MLLYALKAWPLLLRAEETHNHILCLSAEFHLLREVNALAEGHDVGICLSSGVSLEWRDPHEELVANDAQGPPVTAHAVLG